MGDDPIRDNRLGDDPKEQLSVSCTGKRMNEWINARSKLTRRAFGDDLVQGSTRKRICCSVAAYTPRYGSLLLSPRTLQ